MLKLLQWQQQALCNNLEHLRFTRYCIDIN